MRRFRRKIHSTASRRRQLRTELLEDRRLLAADLQLVENNPRTASSGIDDITQVGDSIYFAAKDGSGVQIWRHSPATNSTLPLLHPSTNQPVSGSDLTAYRDALVFGGSISNDSSYLFDPIAHSLMQLSTIYSGDATVFSSSTVFRADDGNVGEELWRYDNGGTVSLVADPGNSPGPSGIDALIPGSDELYFGAQYNTTDATLGVNNLYRADAPSGTITPVFTTDFMSSRTSRYVLGERF